jgi:nucleotide-binding universal stress UspA family protein
MSASLQEARSTEGSVAPSPAAPASNPALHGPVLLATDGADRSGASVIAARLLAEQLGVLLEVVTVLQPEAIYGVALGGTPIYLPEVDEARRANRAAAVNDFLARYSGDAATPTVHMRFGGIADEIARVARERNATLVVVSAAPHQRVNRFIAGERAVQVLRGCTVPVLSVPPGFSALPRNVLVAVDFAPASVRAAQTALLLLGKGGTLTLLHLLSPLLGDAPLRDVTGRDPANAVQTLFGRLRDELRPYVPEDTTIETRVRSGQDAEGIVACATALGADLIAVGTHGPRLLERIFVGSVAARVVHTAAQTVLAVPPPAAGEALELWLRIAGTATSTRPRDWTEALDAFSRRNKRRQVTIEIDDPQVGAQVLARGVFAGATYDRNDQRVEVMVGQGDDVHRHVTHSIPSVESIVMTADERGASEVLELCHGLGHTLVFVTD